MIKIVAMKDGRDGVFGNRRSMLFDLRNLPPNEYTVIKGISEFMVFVPESGFVLSRDKSDTAFYEKKKAAMAPDAKAVAYAKAFELKFGALIKIVLAFDPKDNPDYFTTLPNIESDIVIIEFPAGPPWKGREFSDSRYSVCRYIRDNYSSLNSGTTIIEDELVFG